MYHTKDMRSVARVATDTHSGQDWPDDRKAMTGTLALKNVLFWGSVIVSGSALYAIASAVSG